MNAYDQLFAAGFVPLSEDMELWTLDGVTYEYEEALDCIDDVARAEQMVRY